jgi:hypothetical protein
MTIAVGFRCSDGIVLCADSQMTASDGMRYDAEKLLGYSNDNDISAVFALTGAEVFSKMCIDRLAKRVLNSNASDVNQDLRDETLRIHQEYAPQALANAGEYDLDVLVGVKFRLQDRDVLGLFHIEGPAVSPPITTFDCIGIGRTVAREAISLFYKPRLPVQQANRVAVYCLQKVKNHVEGCGGPSQIISIWDDTDDVDEESYPSDPVRMDQSAIAEIEKGFVGLFAALRPVFLSFNDSHPFQNDFDEHFKQAMKDVKKQRNEFFGGIRRRVTKEQKELKQFIDGLTKIVKVD